MHYVYLLKHKTEPRFKIGRAMDIFHRLSGLKEEYFDLENSMCIELNTHSLAVDIEKHLHFLFDKYRLVLKEKISEGGGTEYFNIECFQQVLDYLLSCAILRPEMQPFPIPKREISYYEARIQNFMREIERQKELEIEHANRLENERERMRSNRGFVLSFQDSDFR